MAYQPTTNFGWAMPRGGDQAQISVINQQFTAKADEIVYQTRRMIAPGYIDDGTKTYHEGEIVEYENVDYVCTGTTSGAWDSSKWDSTDMATQIQEAKESGGTNVEANPVEAATADLHKLKVDTTVYGIPDPTVTKTATGNPIVFTDGADAPLVKCVTQITGYQSGTGTPSPDNIRPIVAYTEGEIEVRGRNLTQFASATSDNSGTIRAANGTIYNGIENGKTYTVSFDMIVAQKSTVAEGNRIGIWLNDTGTSLWRPPISTIGHQTFTFTATDDGEINFWCTGAYNGNTKVIDNIQIEEGSVGHDYEPYTSTTHTTTYPSAIYRGSEDCVKGEVTSEFLLADMGDLTYVPIADSGGRFYTDSLTTTIKSVNYVSEVTSAKCSCYESTTGYNTAQKIIDGSLGLDGIGRIYFYDSSMDGKTAEQIKTALTGQQLAYELATPTTSSVTTTNLPIKSLSGYNHIESSTGEMEVEYITDTYQPLVDLIDDAARQREVYSTDEQEIGTWVDGSKLYQKTYTFSGTGAANPYSTTVDMTGKTVTNVIPHYAKYTYNGGTVGYCVGSKLTANNSNVLNIQYNDDAPPTLDVIANLGGLTETYEVCFTLQYIKTPSNNRSLSKGSTDSLKADLSEEKKEIEESVDKVDKVDEPTETIEEKEENAGESNSENER